MAKVPEIDWTKHYLGKLCKCGHGWGRSGKSVRYVSNRHCRDCERERQREQYRHDPAYRARQAERIKEHLRERRRDPAYRARQAKYDRQRRAAAAQARRSAADA